jgi:endonuclease/exonuclease/phosphatase family metal-dependent hydrolase
MGLAVPAHRGVGATALSARQDLDMTTIATWNLHHWARETEVPRGVAEVIKAADPDVLVLTEYFRSDKTQWFEHELKDQKFRSITVSPAGKDANQNRILIASKHEQTYGLVALQGPDEAASTNFLHRRIPALDLDVIGFRAPFYDKQPETWAPYWELLADCTMLLATRNVVAIGDFNWSTRKGPASAKIAIKRLLSAGFQLVNSVWPPTAEYQSTLDPTHLDNALLSGSLRCTAATYAETLAGHALTGPAAARPLSDHAMLRIEVERR